MLRELKSTLVVLKDRKTRHSLTQTCLENNISFTASPRATYSASEVERVKHFCVLENQHAHAPAHIIATPDTDLLSVALLA